MHGGTRLHTHKQRPPKHAALCSVPPAHLCFHLPLAALNIWRRGTRSQIPHCTGQIYCLFPWSVALSRLQSKLSCNSALQLFPWCISNVYTVLNRLSEPGAIIGRKGFVPLAPQKNLGVWRAIDSWKAAMLKYWHKKGWLADWLCPSHLFESPICRLKAFVSELHSPLEDSDGRIWAYSNSETDDHMQIWSSCWHQKTRPVLKPTAYKTTQSPEGLMTSWQCPLPPNDEAQDWNLFKNNI